MDVFSSQKLAMEEVIVPVKSISVTVSTVPIILIFCAKIIKVPEKALISEDEHTIQKCCKVAMNCVIATLQY
jgi:hypothetical protein